MLKVASLLILSLLLTGCSLDDELSQEEQKLLLTKADFLDYGIELDGQGSGDYSKFVNYAARTTDLSYQLTDSQGFYLNTSVSISSSAANAVINGVSEQAAMSVALKATSELTEEVIDLGQTYGTRSKLILLKNKGEPIGNLFNAVVGKKSFTVVFSGVYFDEAESFNDFIGPKMDYLRQYDETDPLLGWAEELVSSSDSESSSPRKDQPKNQ